MEHISLDFNVKHASMSKDGKAALADKLETLVGMFGIGNLPTGDKDPFALRRSGRAHV